MNNLKQAVMNFIRDAQMRNFTLPGTHVNSVAVGFCKASFINGSVTVGTSASNVTKPYRSRWCANVSRYSLSHQTSR